MAMAPADSHARPGAAVVLGGPQGAAGNYEETRRKSVICRDGRPIFRANVDGCGVALMDSFGGD